MIYTSTIYVYQIIRKGIYKLYTQVKICILNHQEIIYTTVYFVFKTALNVLFQHGYI